MHHAIRRAGWLVGVIWFLSWFELYLEVYRYHHVALPHIFGLPSPTLAVGAGAKPGGWLRSVMVCSALAPLLFVTVRLWRWWQRTRAGAAALAQPEPTFPMVPAVAVFGVALCVLGTINQLIRQPAIEVDLTLRKGNGGFIVLGMALVLAGLVLAWARGGESARGTRSSRRSS